MQKSSDSTPGRPRLVELFSGAGGLTLGCHQAGFETVAAFDMDTDLTSCFGVNFPKVALHNLDLAETPISEIAALVGDAEVDGVVGGPPCQGFSEMGRRSVSDPRNDLLVRFAQIVNAIEPRFFVAENVPGLTNQRFESTLETFIASFSERYTVLEPTVLNAADFGAATRRKRLVIVGFDEERVRNPLSLEDLQCAQKATTVKAALRDLPAELRWESAELRYGIARPKVESYAGQMRRQPPDGLGSAEARERLRQNIVANCAATQHSKQVVARFNSVKQGERDSVSRYPRLDWSRPAPVLRAGTGNDKGSYQAARPIHPEVDRVITVREAARLQGFPDWFEFPPTKWHSHRMIGNSVCPIFAAELMGKLRRVMF